jgi:hypothetical protein
MSGLGGSSNKKVGGEREGKKSACIVAHDKTHKEKKKEREREVNT